MLELDLAAVAQAVSRARTSVTELCTDAGFGGSCDDVALLVSEVVTNAVRYGRGARMRVCASVTTDRLRVDVQDGNPDLDLDAALPARYSEHGRGLVLVDRVATAWGVRDIRGDGKSVWFEVARPS